MLRMGHCLIVAHTTLLPSTKTFSFDTSVERDIIMGRESLDSTLLLKLTGSHVVYETHMITSILS